MTSLREQLEEIQDASHLHTSDAARSFYSSDIFYTGEDPFLAICPPSVDQLQKSVHAITSAGFAVIPRGAGASYTGGAVPNTSKSVVIDTCCLGNILEVNTESMYVIVEAGCTWEALRAELLVHGVRTPYWGPLSGGLSTIGGSLAQEAVMWGSAKRGPVSESVLGLDVVISDGTRIRLGMGHSHASVPFWRHYGPDLTGLFLGDSGAFGVKYSVALRLVIEPPCQAFISFEFLNPDQLVDAMAEIARRELSSTGFALDPTMADQRIRRASLKHGAEAVISMIGKSRNKVSTIIEAARIASEGRTFISTDGYSLHIIAEESSESSINAALDAIRVICDSGNEIPATVPKLLFSKPYASISNAMGPEGQRWSALNCILPLGKAKAGWKEIENYLLPQRRYFETYEIEYGYMVSTISTTAVLIEIIMTWPGPLTPYMYGMLSPQSLKSLPDHRAEQQIDDYIGRIRLDLNEIFFSLGAAHLQIGRHYKFSDSIDFGSLSLLKTIKNHVDPLGLMNPGALGI